MSDLLDRVAGVARTKVLYACVACGHEASQWAGRCSACGEWGSVAESLRPALGSHGDGAGPLDEGLEVESRITTGVAGLDRVLGGGLVPGSVVLLAGAPGIGKSTLLLHVLANLGGAGAACLLASGEESRSQVACRARRLGIDAARIRFAPGRELGALMSVARAERPFALAVDSIQTLRDPRAPRRSGGSPRSGCASTSSWVWRRSRGSRSYLAGHVTKDGDLAGPRALEHAVDVVLSFEGDVRSGLRVLAGGKNRFGAEGETAWFEMTPTGLLEIDPTDLLVSGEAVAGSAVALPQVGRRSMAVDIQALVGSPDGPARRQVTGLDGRRFQLVAAVLDRAGGLPLGRAELFGAVAGGARVDDPACDLAVAAALTSAATGIASPPGTAFVGEVSLTGLVRPAPAMAARLQAARAAGCSEVFAAEAGGPAQGLSVLPVRHIRDALGWALPPSRSSVRRLPA